MSSPSLQQVIATYKIRLAVEAACGPCFVDFQSKQLTDKDCLLLTLRELESRGFLPLFTKTQASEQAPSTGSWPSLASDVWGKTYFNERTYRDFVIQASTSEYLLITGEEQMERAIFPMDTITLSPHGPSSRIGAKPNSRYLFEVTLAFLPEELNYKVCELERVLTYVWCKHQTDRPTSILQLVGVAGIAVAGPEEEELSDRASAIAEFVLKNKEALKFTHEMYSNKSLFVFAASDDDLGNILTSLQEEWERTEVSMMALEVQVEEVERKAQQAREQTQQQLEHHRQEFRAQFQAIQMQLSLQQHFQPHHSRWQHCQPQLQHGSSTYSSAPWVAGQFRHAQPQQSLFAPSYMYLPANTLPSGLAFPDQASASDSAASLGNSRVTPMNDSASTNGSGAYFSAHQYPYPNPYPYYQYQWGSGDPLAGISSTGPHPAPVRPHHTNQYGMPGAGHFNQVMHDQGGGGTASTSGMSGHSGMPTPLRPHQRYQQRPEQSGRTC